MSSSKVISLVLLTFFGSLSLSLSLNPNPDLRPTEENCLKLFGDNAYWVGYACFFKVNSPMRLSDEIERARSYENLFECPAHSGFGYSSYDGSQCTCNTPYYPSPDKKTCVVGSKRRGEPCSGQEGSDDCAGLMGIVCLENRTCGCKDAVWNSTISRCFSDKLCQERWASWGSKYDEKTGACIGKADADCNLERGVACPATSFCKPGNARSWGSGRTYNGKCTCPEGTELSRDRLTCKPILLLGDACQFPPTRSTNQWERPDDPCSPAAKLECMDGKCGCPMSTNWYNASASCAIRPGESCSSYSNYDDSLKCGPSSVCSSSICKCRPGYSVSQDDGFCYGEYGSGCRADPECGKGLGCLEGACVCPFPLQQRYITKVHKFWGNNGNEGKCLALIGSTCSETIPCATGAHCFNGTCKCIPGFSPTLSGSCLMSHGTPNCQLGMCNSDQGLACIENSCQCMDPSAEYVEGQGCVSSLGGLCGEVGTVGVCGTSDYADVLKTDCELAQFRVGCKGSLVCTTVAAGTARCLSGAESLHTWSSKYIATQAEADVIIGIDSGKISRTRTH